MVSSSVDSPTNSIVIALINALPSVCRSSNCVDALRDLKTALHSTRPADLGALLNSQPEVIKPLVEYLLDIEASRSTVQATCDCLQVCVDCLSGDTLSDTFQPLLTQGFDSADPNVNLLSIRAVKAIVKRPSPSSRQKLTGDQAAISALVTCISKDLCVAEPASKALHDVIGLLLGDTSNGEDFTWLQGSLQAAVVNDLVKVRVQELLVDLSVGPHSSRSFPTLSSWPIFQDLLSDCQSEDVLLQLNTIHVIANLATCKHGLQFLQDQGILRAYSNLFQNVNSHPFPDLILPGLLKFFGGVCSQDAKLVSKKHPAFFNTLFKQLGQADPVALQTVTFIARSPQGKRVLQTKQPQFDMVCLHLVGSLCHSSDTSQRAQGFNAARDLFAVVHSNDESSSDVESISSLLCNWWVKCGLTFEHLLDQLRLPFEDVRIALHELLIALLPFHTWALEGANNCGGFVDYILGRQHGLARGVLLSKYDLVCALSESPLCRDVLGDPIYVKLHHYKSMGPYWSISDPQVATQQE